MTLDDVGREIFAGAVERCTPAELAVASSTVRRIDAQLPGDFPANAARVITALRFLLDTELVAQLRRLRELGIDADLTLDGSDTITDRILRIRRDELIREEP